MSDYQDLLEQLRLEKRELTWRAADAIEALVRERDEVVALAKDTEDARVEVAIRLMEVAREKHETEARAEKAEAALMADTEDLTLQICFDKVVKDRDAYKARAERAEAALKECADDLEEELRARYEMGADKKVYMQARFDRDMQPVLNARAVLTQTKGDQNE